MTVAIAEVQRTLEVGRGQVKGGHDCGHPPNSLVSLTVRREGQLEDVSLAHAPHDEREGQDRTNFQPVILGRDERLREGVRANEETWHDSWSWVLGGRDIRAVHLFCG